jgi:CheY-like chemotaxis protein
MPAVISDHMDAATPPAHAELPSISGLRILVVDDDADAREVVGLTLESRGALVQVATSAADALDSIRRQKPDLMIADIGMPKEDGYVMIQKLRAVEHECSHDHLPAIALTAYASAADLDQALAMGYDVHLTKPVGPNDLIHAVAKFCKTRRSEA